MTKSRGQRRIAVILCLIPAAYFLLTAVYALLNYGDFASDMPRLMRYVIGPLAIVAILALCAFALSADTSLMIGITATSILIGLFVFEGYMRLQLLPQQIGLAGVVDDDVDLGRFGNAMPPAYTIKSMNFQLNTERLSDAVLSGVPDEEIMLCSRMGEPVVSRSDENGFRNPLPLPEAPVDLMVIGDSFAEGICLPDGAHFVDQLREGDFSVMNTASRGSGPLFELAVLGRYGPIYQPDTTLMAFFEGNDWENLANEAVVPWMAEALEPGADFGAAEWTDLRRGQISEVISDWWSGSAASINEYLRRRSFLRNLLALQNTANILGLHYPKAMDENPDYERVLRRGREIAGEWGGKLVVVYIPSLDRFGGLFPHEFVQDPLRGMVLGAADRAGVEVIDLTPVFREAEEAGSLYAPDSHFNARGATLAAETILNHPAILSD
ncbi:hypothetical protein SAMN05421538_101403 [Paracoccus isoporae]|uniref:SGNH hydrolase-type esterase domain-containing protein n=1 Tax=Paracoccus isoporae TaxID=591205 RepID=A0A1G6TXM4_9RHOB|nr:hypothetical protein [Paracoccus isoporae]SDD33818.1 hypothetical protein SAMN05421538_101403 [Paracoccus isoporae]